MRPDDANSVKKKAKTDFLFAALILGTFVAVFFGFYLQGIPYEQEGGVYGWRMASETPWPYMFGYLFNPVSLTATATNTLLIQTRVTELIIQKFIFLAFGDSMTAMASYRLIVTVLFSLTLLWAGKKWTGSLPPAIFLTIFLLATPAYGWTIMEYGDFSPLDQLLLLYYLFFFIAIYESFLVESPIRFSAKQILRLIGLWILGIVTVRTKESNKFLVPGLSWLIFFLNPKWNSFTVDSEKKLRGMLPLCFVLALLSLPVVLVKKVQSSLGLSWENLKAPFYIFFQNPYGLDSQNISALFSLRRVYPSSIVSNFGFFLSWSAIGSALYLLCSKRSNSKHAQAPHVSIPFLLIGWTLLSLSFHIVYSGLEFTRYLTWALLPFTLLVALCYTEFLKFWPGAQTKKIFASLLIFFTVISIFNNGQASIYVRKHLESIWVPKWSFRAEVYKDQRHVKSAGLFEYTRYWYPRPLFLRAIEPYLEPERPHKDLAEDKKFQDILKKYDVAYVASTQPLMNLPWKTTLIKTLDQKDFSLLTALKMKYTHKPRKMFYLYRING